MNRVLLAMTLWVGLVWPAFAQSIEDQILASLRAQGYVILEQGYTFLGRLRIVAENDQIHREIVVNPGTGEILRDYAVSKTRLATAEPPRSEGGRKSAPAVAASQPTPSDTGVASALIGTVARVATATGGDVALAPAGDAGQVVLGAAGGGVDGLEILLVLPLILNPAGQK